MGDGGAMGSSTVGLQQQGREMGGDHLLEMLIREIMEILNTTGIHKQVGEPKKVRKKVQPFVTKKGEIGGLTFFLLFSIVEKTGNTQMIAAWYKAYIGQISKETREKR
jgi:hypothetical protein